MSRSLRLLSGAVLALLLTQTALPAAALDNSSALPLMTPSVTGGYLAGRQALLDMRTDDAARYFADAALADWDNPFLVERSFVAYAVNGEIEQAAKAAKHLGEISGQNDLASLVIATVAIKDRRYQAAADTLASPGSDTYAGVMAKIMHSWALVGIGRTADAQSGLEAAGKDGLEAYFAFHRMLIALVAGRQDEALTFGKAAYEAEPYDARVVEAYTRILGNAGKFDDAKKVLDDYASQGLSNPLVDKVREAVLKQQAPGPFIDGIASGAAEALTSIGVDLVQEGAPEIAATFFRLGMYLAPKSDGIDLVYGQLLDQAGRHEEANAIYDGIAADSPEKPMAVVRAAENLDALGNLDEALRQLTDIAARNPTDIDALSTLGDMQRNAKKYVEAAASYSKVIDLSGNVPANWRYYYVRGIAYERSKQWPLAEADFKKALELNPNQPQVLNYLGYSWVDQGVNLLPALDMIQKAVDGSPNDGYIIDSLGWAYYRLGRYAEAVTTLERAVQMKPVDPEINDHLGDAYWRLGRKLEARFQWNIASTVDQEGVVKARVAPKLINGLEDLPPVNEAAAQSPTTAPTAQ